jgi:hypothetical protein
MWLKGSKGVRSRVVRWNFNRTGDRYTILNGYILCYLLVRWKDVHSACVGPSLVGEDSDDDSVGIVGLISVSVGTEGSGTLEGGRISAGEV